MSTSDAEWGSPPAERQGTTAHRWPSRVPATVPLEHADAWATDGAGAGAGGTDDWRALAPQMPQMGSPVPPTQSGVNALRSILLRGQSNGAVISDEARLAAIEQRLDALARELAREPAAQGPQLASLERRVDALTTQLQGTHAAVRAMGAAAGPAADPAVVERAGERLTSVERQVVELRLDHDQLAANATAFANELDQACRLRQRRVRVANRLELQRLRRRVYAPAGAFGGRVAGDATDQSESAMQAARLEQTAQLAGLDATGTASFAHADDADEDGGDGADVPHWPLPRHMQVVNTPEGADQVPRHQDADAVPLDALDAAGAWHAVRHAAVTLALALWALLVVLGRLIADDARAVWEWARESWHGGR